MEFMFWHIHRCHSLSMAAEWDLSLGWESKYFSFIFSVLHAYCTPFNCDRLNSPCLVKLCLFWIIFIFVVWDIQTVSIDTENLFCNILQDLQMCSSSCCTGATFKLKLFCLFDVVFLNHPERSFSFYFWIWNNWTVLRNIYTEIYDFSRHVPRGFWYTWSFLIYYKSQHLISLQNHFFSFQTSF